MLCLHDRSTLFRSQLSSNDNGYYCSGTLITSSVVVTAGHCHGVTRVFLGGNNIAMPDGGETIAVLHEFSHPEVD
ncbi:MAG: trypsin-like serine protease, partial [Deltaproteobacteria bacterium]|nr:trypsin-like serine protease [Deltaproteobacteria bacterium]